MYNNICDSDLIHFIEVDKRDNIKLLKVLNEGLECNGINTNCLKNLFSDYIFLDNHDYFLEIDGKIIDGDNFDISLLYNI